MTYDLAELKDLSWEGFSSKVFDFLLFGDCLQLMKDIPSASIDMILCDLPYGVTQNKKDNSLPFDALWQQYERIIKPNGCIALYAQGLFYVDLVNSNRKLYRYDLVWDKVLVSGFLNAKRMPLRSHEQIAIFYKSQPTYNPQMTIGRPLHSKGSAYRDKPGKNQNYGHFNQTDDSRSGETLKYPKSIIQFPKPHPSVSIHRTEKSIECNKWLIETFTNPGDRVLDNCAGSGTTGVACQQTKRMFTLMENDATEFEKCKKRLTKDGQWVLFSMEEPN